MAFTYPTQWRDKGVFERMKKPHFILDEIYMRFLRRGSPVATRRIASVMAPTPLARMEAEASPPPAQHGAF